jgi:hypothetical protein
LIALNALLNNIKNLEVLNQNKNLEMLFTTLMFSPYIQNYIKESFFLRLIERMDKAPSSHLIFDLVIIHGSHEVGSA